MAYTFFGGLPPINFVDNGATTRIALNNNIQYSHSFAPGTKPGDILLQKIFLREPGTPGTTYPKYVPITPGTTPADDMPDTLDTSFENYTNPPYDFSNTTVYINYCGPILSLIDMDARKETLVQSVEDTAWRVMPATYEFPISLTDFKAARGNTNPCVVVVESKVFNPNFPQCPAVPATMEEWETHKNNVRWDFSTIAYFRGVFT